MKVPYLIPLLLLVLTAATSRAQDAGVDSSTISPPLGFIPQPFDVLHYEAELDLTSAPEPFVRGVCDVRLRWIPQHQGTRYFAFHLRGPAVEQVLLDGTPVVPVVVGDSTMATYHFRVDVPPIMDPPDTSVVRIVYSGAMTDELGPGYWGGVSSMEGQLFAMGVGFMNNYISTTQHWLPCYDHPSDKATFRGLFKVLDPMSVAGNGTLQISRRGDTAVYEWTELHPAATYLLTFAVAPYVALDLGDDPVPMVIYSERRDTGSTKRSFTLLPRMISLYSRHFGPYPYDKVGYVNTAIGSMEHQSMISFDVDISRSGDTINPVAAHELAHQWFGDLVTGTDYRHAWLSESFATFSEALWHEELGGFSAYLGSIERMRKWYVGTLARREGIFPLYDFPRTPPSSNYPGTIYQKGGVVVGMLRYELGDSVFFAALQEYLRRFNYGVATTEDLRSVLEEYHGSSLDWFFNQWVYEAGWPVLSINAAVAPQGGDLNVAMITVEQSPSAGDVLYRGVPVELGFVGPDSTTYRVVRLDQRSQSFVLDSIPDITGITVNSGPSVRALLVANPVTSAPPLPDSGTISVRVQPNPSDGSDALHVSVHGTVDCGGLRYELFNPSGRRVGTGEANACEFTIPVEGIASGAYVIRIRLSEEFHDVSVVIAR